MKVQMTIKEMNVYLNMMLEQWHVSPIENEGVLHHDMGERCVTNYVICYIS